MAILCQDERAWVALKVCGWRKKVGTQYPWQWLTKHKQGKVDSCCKAGTAPESTREPHNVHLCGHTVACAWNLLKDLQNMQISSSFCISYGSQSSYVKVYIYSLKSIILIIFWNHWKLIYLFLKYAWEVTRFDHCLFSFNKWKLSLPNCPLSSGSCPETAVQQTAADC